MAWNYWLRRLDKPGKDKIEVVEHLEYLTHTPYFEDNMNSNYVYEWYGHKRFVVDLKRSLEKRFKPKNSVQRLIESFTDLSTGVFHEYLDDTQPSDARYKALMKLGLDAVPDLITYLEDERLTQHISHGSPWSYHHRLGGIVGEVLYSLSGLRALDTAKIEAWYQKALQIGEEEYLVQNAIKVEEGSREDARCNNHILQVIAWKYPHRLGEIYERMITQYPTVHKHLLTDLIAEYYPNKERKGEILLQAAKGAGEQEWFNTYHDLIKIKHPQLIPLLVERMEKTPPSFTDSSGVSPAVLMAQLTRDADHKDLWEALEKLAHRSEVGQRMEMLSSLTSEGKGGRTHRHTLEFLGRFLDDAEERTLPIQRTSYEYQKYVGTSAVNGAWQLSVRNMVAHEIAKSLGISIRPGEAWTEAHWKELRECVKKALHSKQH